MEGGLDKEDLLAMSRVKGKLCAIFLSDLVTADGKHMETFAFQKESSVRPSSKYRFPREEPTDHDWQVWIGFWRQHTVGNFQLHTPLGGWIAPTHRQWKWFYDEENECLQKKTGLKTEHYFLVGSARTRSQNTHVKIWEGETEPSGLPASVKQATKESVTMFCSGPKLFTSPTYPSNFWEYLERQGGHWIWEGRRKEN